jgi:hypothetical protein
LEINIPLGQTFGILDRFGWCFFLCLCYRLGFSHSGQGDRHHQDTVSLDREHHRGNQPPVMIPPIKLGLLALGLAGWPLEMEANSQGSYRGRRSYTFCSSPPFLFSQWSNILPGLVFGGRSKAPMGLTNRFQLPTTGSLFHREGLHPPYWLLCCAYRFG